eukprot:Cvel_6212.t1-p1 / transcript=Cvel_6212.t1 / gene=Cvel_6212 / organism=Chromera_velia_CCMP2878 / gene_product=Putative inactive phenolphthiocerol synthesis, putative / transcript_product=Putative inactive phenolphthiocerol synthesis, putative / location=Cvel_scaffold300:95231-105286(+) / protein_length=2635 / sequence_SO=supercontig / SO=protein_coding / is_pseudo=false
MTVEVNLRESLSLPEIAASAAVVLARVGLSDDVAIKVFQKSEGGFIVVRLDVSSNPTFKDLCSRVTSSLEAARETDSPAIAVVDDCLASLYVTTEAADAAALEGDGPPICLVAHGDGARVEGLGVRTVTGSWIDTEVLARCFESFLEAVSASEGDPLSLPVGSFPLVSSSDRALLLQWAGGVPCPPKEVFPPGAETLHETFFNRCSEAPDRIRVLPPLGSSRPPLSMGFLRASALSIAQRLQRDCGVVPGDRVAVSVGHDPIFPAVMVGVMAAGAACVALDPADTDDAKAYILSAAGCRVCVSLTDEPSPVSSVSTVSLDTLLAPLDAPDAKLPSGAVSGSSEALVIFTSGSTGNPSGVSLSHKNLMNSYAGLVTETYGGQEAILWQANCRWILGFAQSVLALMAGLRVSVCPKSIVQSPPRLEEQMKEHGVTLFWGIPSMLATLARAGVSYRNLRLIVFGGEPGRSSDVSTILSAAGESVPVINSWGMTEIGFTAQTRVKRAEEPLPLGRPMSNIRLFVLDKFGSLLPPSCKGILWASGPTVTRGYVNNAERNVTKFCEKTLDLLSEEGAQTLFCTDDMAAWGEGGCLTVHGRADGRVRVRGQYVETAVVEKTLRDLEFVSAASVMEVGGTLAAAVVTSRPGLQSSTVRAALRGVLPGHSIPSVISVIDQLPRTSTGKLDRASLKRSLSTVSSVSLAGDGGSEESGLTAATDGTQGVLPNLVPSKLKTEVKAVAVEAAAFVLGTPAESTPTDVPLLDLGLDSLGAVEFRNRLFSNLGGIDLPVTILFDHPTIEELAAWLAQHLSTSGDRPLCSGGARASLSAQGETGDAGVAVVGVACRFPGGSNSPNQFWEMMMAKRDCMSEVPLNRWNNEALFDPDPDATGKTYVREAAFIEGIELFDNGFFSISAAEAGFMDPQQRHMLEVGYEAFCHAGQTRETLSGSASSVFVGTSYADWHSMDVENRSSALVGTGTVSALLANRTSYAFGLKGPSVTLDTACSSALVALDAGVSSVRAGGSALSLVGGVNLMLSPFLFINFCKARMLSADGRCKTFDESANGYARGEGVGAVVLQRLADARAQEKPVFAIVRGSAVNHDGRSASLTAPNGLSQQDVIRSALADGGVSASEVCFVEAHGTGTALGDPIEVGALKAVYGEGRGENNPLVLGVVKTNMGHLEGAAGIAGFIKLVLVLQHRTAPPNLHLKKLNPHLDIDGFPVVMPSEAVEIGVGRTAGGERRGKLIGAVSSFGFGGANAHVVVEEGDAVIPVAGPEAKKRPCVEWDHSSFPFAPVSHPLVGRLVDDGQGVCAFESVLRREVHQLIEEHKGFGRALMPGSLMLETLAVCVSVADQVKEGGSRTHTESARNKVPEPFHKWHFGAAALHEKSANREREVVVLEDFEIQNPMIIPPLVESDQRPQVSVSVSCGGGVTLSSSGPWVAGREESDTEVHARCSSFAIQSGHRSFETMASDALRGLREACRVEESVQSLYDKWEQAGLSFGRRFQTMQQLWKNADGSAALARLSLDPQSDELGEGKRKVRHNVIDRSFRLHPALLEGALQAGLSLLSIQGNDGVIVPVAVERALISAIDEEQGSDLWAHVEAVSRSSSSSSFNVRLFTATGRVVGELSGVHARPLDLSAPARIPRELLWEVKWQPAAALPVTSPGEERSSSKFLFLDAPPKHAAEIARLHPTSQVVQTGEVPEGETLLHLLRDSEWTGVFFLGSLEERASQANATAVAWEAIRILQAVSSEKWPKGTLRPFVRLLTVGGVGITGVDAKTNQAAASVHAGLLGLARAAGIDLRSSRVQLGSADLDPALPVPEAVAELVRLIDVRSSETAQSLNFEDEVAVRGGELLVARLRKSEMACRGAIEVHMAERGAVSNLKARPQALEKLRQSDLGRDLVEVRVRAVGLNFRDVLNVMGLYPGDPGLPGTEFAGTVTRVGSGVTRVRVGDDVFGVAVGGLRTFAVTRQQLVAKKPRRLTFEEASTLPVVAATVEYALRDLAKVKRGDRVLIHAASGGVGLTAVQFCKVAGASVFVTVGSEEKAAFVRSLGVEYVTSSRDAERFESDMTSFLQGQKLDVVLNSLSDEFIDASLRLLGEGGRFMEIGKRKIWSHEKMHELRPDVQYETIAVDVMFTETPAWFAAMMDRITGLVEAGEMQGLPMRVFDATSSDAESDGIAAFRFLQRAAHIGKVVVAFPSCIETPSQSDGCTYIITGGLGGLGLVVANWLLDEGAKRIILVSRRSAPDAETVKKPEMVRLHRAAVEGTVEVEFRSCDVSVPEQCESLLQSVAGNGRFGLIHLAGATEASSIKHQTLEGLNRVYAAKAGGAWNLHEALGRLGLEERLETFVLFSSVSALFGAQGRAAYSAANASVDALATFRVRQGLRAVSIQWGPWEEQGMALAEGGMAQLRLFGYRGLSNEVGLRVLGDAMRASVSTLAEEESWPPVVGCASILWNAFMQKYDDTPPFFSQVQKAEERSKLSPQLQQLLESTSHQQLKEHVTSVAVDAAVKVLGGSSSSDAPPMDAPLREVGIDSLGAVEFRNDLSARLGVRLPATALFNYPTLTDMVGFLCKQIDSAASKGREGVGVTTSGVRGVLGNSSLFGEEAGVAVVGVACRFPGGSNSPGQFWEMMMAKRDC